MCSVSMIGDHYRDMWQPLPWYQQTYPNTNPLTPSLGFGLGGQMQPQISRSEFDELKRQVLEMKELLKRAKKYDEDNGEPDCEMDDKMAVLRRVAGLVDITLDDVFGPAPKQ